jgi:serpin B
MRKPLGKSIAVVLLLAACGKSGPEEVRSKLSRVEDPPVTQEQLYALTAANRAFAAEMYTLAAAQESGNLFMSPHSVTTALALLYAGAGGETAAQIADALNFVMPPTELHAAMNKLDLELAKREAEAPEGAIPFRLRAANAVFVQKGKPFEATYLDLLALNYGAGVFVHDFESDPEGGREEINGWVAERTNDKIPELLPAQSITALTRLVLTNALYFSAAWNTPFDKEQTADGVFHAPGGDRTVPMMHGASDREGASDGYGQGPRFRVGELTYDGENVAMDIIIPELLPEETTGDPLALLEAALTPDKLEEIIGSIAPQPLAVTMPKFEFRAKLTVASSNDPDAPEGILADLGMIDAFIKDLADLSPMSAEQDGLYVKKALHEGYVAVDEDGTEAAAATAVIVGDDSAPPEPIEFVVDRPFLVVIRDLPTGEILFIGRVVDPSVH